MSFCLSVCLSVCLFVLLKLGGETKLVRLVSVFFSVCLFCVCLFVCLICNYLSICHSVCYSLSLELGGETKLVRLGFCLSVFLCLCVFLSLSLSVFMLLFFCACLFVCLICNCLYVCHSVCYSLSLSGIGWRSKTGKTYFFVSFCLCLFSFCLSVYLPYLFLPGCLPFWLLYL